MPVRFAFLLGARTHLPATAQPLPPPQPTLSSSLQLFAKAHLFFPWSSVFGLLLHSCSPLIRCSTPSKSAPEEGGRLGERSQPWAQLSFPSWPCASSVHGRSPSFPPSASASFRAANPSASFYTPLGYLGSCAAFIRPLLAPSSVQCRAGSDVEGQVLQEMLQTEATKQRFCIKSSEENFRQGREVGRCLLASKGLLLGDWE